jgi:tRNA modification GTPase
MNNTETICALATPQGRAGVAVIRLSGPNALAIAKKITHLDPTPRYAHTSNFYDQNCEIIDQGILLYFVAPKSFTGEDVVEFHLHGNPFVCQRLLNCLCSHGARLAIAGEFSERAFINGKLDLSQLEAIADLIASGSEQAARSAIMSVRGVFSEQIKIILTQLIQIRTHIEASLDFSEEDIEIETRATVSNKLTTVNHGIDNLLHIAQQGVQLHQGATVVLTGRPNVGKSSLLNAICKEPRAIVTEIPGTTRDLISVDLVINGCNIQLIDTAGLRENAERVEQEGINKALDAIEKADLVLQVYDVEEIESVDSCIQDKKLVLINKIDLADEGLEIADEFIAVSAKTGEGLARLYNEIAQRLGLNFDSHQTPFSARNRHLEAMKRSKQATQQALLHLEGEQPLELVAEELRLAQQHLAEITGEFTPDDLLDYVFREFCIGK